MNDPDTTVAADPDPRGAFSFGQNWRSFLAVIDDERIKSAQESLGQMLERESLVGLSFLDVGCGSGLFSLAAARMGARVVSFDRDLESVQCALEIKRRFLAENATWMIKTGSVLDADFLGRLGRFDVVYSWGVLHHTGAMRTALENVATLVAPGGTLFISIYNDQGLPSRLWLRVKRTYNRLPKSLRPAMILGVALFFELRSAALRLICLQNPLPFEAWAERKRARKATRGMSVRHDLVDWVGGYPFEVAKPEEIFTFFKERGFILLKIKTCGGGLGCNEFVFIRRLEAKLDS